jgi:site-specific DNA recombinase
MRAAVYCRLSKNRRGKKANTADQERDCLALIESEGWEHAGSYIDDGISASDKSEKPRDRFNDLMGDLRAGLIDVIVASEFTRLYRRPRELEELLDPVDKFHYNVELVTVDPRVRRWDIRTGIGRAELRAAVNQAAEYSDYIAEKVRNHAKHRATDGRWHGGHPGYGFDYVPVVRDGEGEELEPERMSVNEDQAKVVRRVVWQVLADKRIGSICEALNREGIKTRDGRRWRQGNLHPILTKPAIAGLVRHPEKPDLVRSVWGTFVECSQHPELESGCFGAIISECDYRKLQAILAKPARERNTVGTRSALLTGYIYCGNPKCGKKLIATRDQRGKRVYACKRDSHRAGCGTIKRLADPIDQLVTELVIATLEDSDFKIPLPEGDDFSALDAEKKRLENQQAQLAIDHYRLTKPDGRPLIERIPYLAANEALQADIDAIERKLDRATTHRHVKELPVGEVAQSEWDAHANDLAWRRELISIVLQGRRIVVKPSANRHVPFNKYFGARFDPDSIDFDPPTVAEDHEQEAS